jgi:hypothetical protein
MLEYVVGKGADPVFRAGLRRFLGPCWVRHSVELMVYGRKLRRYDGNTIQ